MDGGSGHGYRGPPSTSFDKSRVLDIKPLRSLVPVFPNPPQAPSFVCFSSFDPFPPGFTPFYPFSAPQGLQSSPDMNQYKTPPAHFSRIPPHFHGAVNGDAEPSRDYDTQFPTDNTNMGGNMMGCLVIQSRQLFICAPPIPPGRRPRKAKIRMRVEVRGTRKKENGEEIGKKRAKRKKEGGFGRQAKEKNRKEKERRGRNPEKKKKIREEKSREQERKKKNQREKGQKKKTGRRGEKQKERKN